MHFSDYLIIVPLAVALLSLWFSRKIWLPLLVMVSVIGYLQDRLTVESLIFLAAGFLVAGMLAAFKDDSCARTAMIKPLCLVSGKRAVIVLLHGCLTAWLLWLFMYGIPEVESVLLLDKVYASVDSIPFTLYLNLDKTVTAFVLAVAIPGLFQRVSEKKQRWQSWLLLALGLLAIQMLACILGLVRPEVKVPSWWWMFALHNLLITCVAEEAFFRGYIQRGITNLWGASAGLICASTLFGLAHYPGGAVYMCLAGLTGIGYGAAWCMTGRLWAPVLTHFLFNLVHLFFYTYPMLRNCS